VHEWRNIQCKSTEVDFITTGQSGLRTLYQVSLELRDNRTREREVNALTTVMQETGITHATIVSLDSEERIETDAGVVNVLPAWLWSLRFLTILQK